MRKFVVIFVSVVLLSTMASANLLLNGDFALNGTPATYTSATINSWNTWGNSGWYNDDQTNMSVKMWWDDSGIYQNFSATPGQAYEFSVDALQRDTEPLTNWWGYLKAEFYDAGSLQIGVQELAYITSLNVTNIWIPLSGIYTAPVGTVQGRIVLGITHWAENPAGSAYFDNASVIAIPEPTIASLFGLSGLLFLAVRRRLRK